MPVGHEVTAIIFFIGEPLGKFWGDSAGYSPQGKNCRVGPFFPTIAVASRSVGRLLSSLALEDRGTNFSGRKRIKGKSRKEVPAEETLMQ
jgi:hypothetical protein